MVDGYGQNDQVAVDEAEGYTGDISGAPGFCCGCGNDGYGENQGSKTLENEGALNESAGLHWRCLRGRVTLPAEREA